MVEYHFDDRIVFMNPIQAGRYDELGNVAEIVARIEEASYVVLSNNGFQKVTFDEAMEKNGLDNLLLDLSTSSVAQRGNGSCLLQGFSVISAFSSQLCQKIPYTNSDLEELNGYKFYEYFRKNEILGVGLDRN